MTGIDTTLLFAQVVKLHVFGYGAVDEFPGDLIGAHGSLFDLEAPVPFVTASC
jgi:hypothetical protein